MVTWINPVFLSRLALTSPQRDNPMNFSASGVDQSRNCGSSHILADLEVHECCPYHFTSIHEHRSKFWQGSTFISLDKFSFLSGHHSVGILALLISSHLDFFQDFYFNFIHLLAFLIQQRINSTTFLHQAPSLFLLYLDHAFCPCYVLFSSIFKKSLHFPHYCLIYPAFGPFICPKNFAVVCFRFLVSTIPFLPSPVGPASSTGRHTQTAPAAQHHIYVCKEVRIMSHHSYCLSRVLETILIICHF